jgi:hypothetical protein
VRAAPPRSTDFFFLYPKTKLLVRLASRLHTTTRARRRTDRDRACSHVDVAEADASQGHRPRRQRVSQPIALPITPLDLLASGLLVFFCSLWLLCGCGRCVGSVRVLLIRCWFDLLCRVGKTSLMNQYPWLDPPDASRLVPSPCLVFPSANRLSCAIP